MELIYGGGVIIMRSANIRNKFGQCDFDIKARGEQERARPIMSTQNSWEKAKKLQEDGQDVENVGGARALLTETACWAEDDFKAGGKH